jgi:hypothetical protein
MLLSISVLVSAQDVKPEKLNTVGDQTAQVIDKVFDRTEAAVSKLAEALKVPASHVYDILVGQQRIQAITNLIGIAFCFLLSFLLIYIPYKCCKNTNINYGKKNSSYKDSNRYDFDDKWYPFSWVSGIIIGTITFIYSICVLSDVVSGLLNPEYGAIKDILKVLQ